MEPSKPLLMARATELQHRANALALSANVPTTRDQITLVALAAADVQTWLVELGNTEVERLNDVARSLDAHARRLDDLEGELGAYRPRVRGTAE
jgi:hypothetical protein